ncbi:hypothetical protein AVEN_188907-1, partial [Araneus ventricosus]
NEDLIPSSNFKHPGGKGNFRTLRELHTQCKKLEIPIGDHLSDSEDEQFWLISEDKLSLVTDSACDEIQEF